MSPVEAKLVVLAGKLEGRTFELGKRAVIGRHPEAQVRIPDVKVSREHSKLYQQGADYYIVDLNSRNGTHVNDAKITKRLLRDGDEISLGDTRFRFVISAPPEKTPAVVEVPKVAAPEKPGFREVIDLTKKPTASPAGAISADQIVLKEKALQFSKIKGRRKPNLFFDDVGQRSFFYQLLIALVAIGAAIAIFVLSLKAFHALFPS